MDGSNVPHIESEKRFKKRSGNGGKVPALQSQLTFLATTNLNPDPRNPRKHDRTNSSHRSEHRSVWVQCAHWMPLIFLPWRVRHFGLSSHS